jgi:hypothetical protein
MLKENLNLVRPRPQESFNKFQRRCPVHIKARCGRCWCNHPLFDNEQRCTKFNCPFYREGEMLLGVKKGSKSKSEYRVPRRYKRVV